MKSKTETSTWFVLRIYKGVEPDKLFYARDVSNSYDSSRYWSTTEVPAEAYKFQSRSDARKTTRAKTFTDKVKRYIVPDGDYFWEVVKVVETRQIAYALEMIVSNAPPLFQLARCAE